MLQRAPDFKSVAVSEEKVPESAGFAVRFNSLSGNAKMVVIGLLLAVIAVIALIVLLAVKLIKSKQSALDEDEDDLMFRTDFDEAEVTDGSVSDLSYKEKNPDSEEKSEDTDNTDTNKTTASEDNTEQ